jgi:hypothetical protein
MKEGQIREPEDVNMKSWDEFQKTGLFWLINSVLHVFGWAIVFEREHGEKDICNVFPARVKYRGFSEPAQSAAHGMIADYLSKNIEELKGETQL